MPSDLFGLPQPTALGPIILGGRFAPVTMTNNASALIYWEQAYLGRLFQPGLPLPVRDNRLNTPLASPGILGAPFILRFTAWGSGSGNSVNAVTMTFQLGDDVLATITAVTAADAGATQWRASTILTPGPTFKQISADTVVVNSAGATPSSSVVTLAGADDMAQRSLSLKVAVVTPTLTINGCLLELLPLLPFSIQDSVVG